MTTWGESHGVSMGCIVDGVPAGIPLKEGDIQPWLDRRKPGTSRFTSQRREDDKVHILSGVFEGKTTGTPIALSINNEDTRSKDYDTIASLYRPGHGDYTYHMKYGVRDYRGGGRASARETVARVAAAAIARQVLGKNIVIRGAVTQIGRLAVDPAHWDWHEVTRNPFHCPDATMVKQWEKSIDAVRKEGSSLGARLYVEACGVPVGWGEPLYHRLDADLSAAMMSIPAVKAVGIGAGFDAISMRGEDHHDGLRMTKGAKGGKEQDHVSFQSNHAGGILGGISSGQDITLQLAVKPTSSIRTPLQTIDTKGHNTHVRTTGRHDPCVGIRAVPVAEAMLALVLCDHMLLHRARHQFTPPS